jgi:integrase
MGIRKLYIDHNEDNELKILERYELLDKIKAVSGGKSGDNKLRDQALIAFLYLTGKRIEEVVRYRIRDQPYDIYIRRKKKTD